VVTEYQYLKNFCAFVINIFWKIEPLINLHTATQNRKANAGKYRNKECSKMSKSSNVVPEARAALDKFKMEAASEVGVNLKNGYNGDLTSKQAGSVGGRMVKNMIQKYEENMK
jgi:small acid-soluble spore protein D (minor alpha/beta-type SASP)